MKKFIILASVLIVFFAFVSVFVISTVIAGIIEDLSVYIYAYIVLVILQLITFSFSLKFYEK